MSTTDPTTALIQTSLQPIPEATNSEIYYPHVNWETHGNYWQVQQTDTPAELESISPPYTTLPEQGHQQLVYFPIDNETRPPSRPETQSTAQASGTASQRQPSYTVDIQQSVKNTTFFQELIDTVTDYIFNSVSDRGSQQNGTINSQSITAKIKTTSGINEEVKQVFIAAILAAKQTTIRNHQLYCHMLDLINIQLQISTKRQQYTNLLTTYLNRQSQGLYQELTTKRKELTELYKQLIFHTQYLREIDKTGTVCMTSKSSKMLAESPFSPKQKALLKELLQFKFSDVEPFEQRELRIGYLLDKTVPKEPECCMSKTLDWLKDQNDIFNRKIASQQAQEDQEVQQLLSALEAIPSSIPIAAPISSKAKIKQSTRVGDLTLRELKQANIRTKKQPVSPPPAFSPKSNQAELTVDELEERLKQLRDDRSPTSEPEQPVLPQSYSYPASGTATREADSGPVQKVEAFLQPDTSITTPRVTDTPDAITVRIDTDDNEITKELKTRFELLKYKGNGTPTINFVNEHNEPIPFQIPAELLKEILAPKPPQNQQVSTSTSQLANATSLKPSITDLMLFSITPANVSTEQQKVRPVIEEPKPSPSDPIAPFFPPWETTISQVEEKRLLDEVNIGKTNTE
ncbi:hypothetical protein D5018_13225 [Parashewanella curva]|uniref:Uncharacterized protein n=1 Tax=Parashewanella curva TaxID=2338552 RepID=A0A3L8PUZ4_9GAMM|nr:hypothetical protein [Parashewanella curva]RLV59237.1 hypothetical protein D5018_13225 [Parashewanella curva]